MVFLAVLLIFSSKTSKFRHSVTKKRQLLGDFVPRPFTGALPLDPTGGLPSPKPPGPLLSHILNTPLMLLAAKLVIFLCSVISQGKVVALDRWSGKWNHLSMTHRVTNNCAKNYCNRTLIVKVNVEKCSHMFFWGHSVYILHHGSTNGGDVKPCSINQAMNDTHLLSAVYRRCVCGSLFPLIDASSLHHDSWLTHISHTQGHRTMTTDKILDSLSSVIKSSVLNRNL